MYKRLFVCVCVYVCVVRASVCFCFMSECVQLFFQEINFQGQVTILTSEECQGSDSMVPPLDFQSDLSICQLRREEARTEPLFGVPAAKKQDDENVQQKRAGQSTADAGKRHWCNPVPVDVE